MKNKFIDTKDLEELIRTIYRENVFGCDIYTEEFSYGYNIISKRDLIYLQGNKNKTPFEPKDVENNDSFPMLYRLGLGTLYGDEGINVEYLNDEEIIVPKDVVIKPKKKRTYNKKKKICSKKKVAKKLTWKEKLVKLVKELWTKNF